MHLMRILINADLILEVLFNRNWNGMGKVDEQLWDIIQQKWVRGYVTDIGLEKISLYASRKMPNKVDTVLSKLQSIMEVCPVNNKTLEEAYSYNLIKVDAAVELVCAIEMNLDGIVALSPQEFPPKTIKIYSVSELLAEQYSQDQIKKGRIALERQFLENHLQNPEPHVSVKNKPAILNQWIQGVFENGWQTPDFIRTRNCFNLKGNNVTKFKPVQLEIESSQQTLLLVVTLEPELNQEVSISVQAHPANSKIYLPANIKLSLLSNLEETLWEVQSRSIDNFIQIPVFKAKLGEKFGVKITLYYFDFIERFIV